MRILLQHQSRYDYPSPASLGPHLIRLRPADHAKANIESYSLTIGGEHLLNWQRDPAGNHVARLAFSRGQRIDELDILVEMVVEIQPINPFDFFVDDDAQELGFSYAASVARGLAPYLDTTDSAFATGPAFDTFFEALPDSGNVIDWMVALCSRTTERIHYIIREEAGTFTPEVTCSEGRGSCRDSAALLVAAFRRAGLAARFVSGYLVQLRDEGMLPDEPRGVDRDVVDLHAWAEVYLPGAGWIGVDGTSGLFCGEGHIPLACTATPATAAPIDGTSDVVASSVRFETRVGRVGHEISVTTPLTEEEWTDLTTRAARNDQRLLDDGLVLTVGGEPTFNSRDNAEAPEWRTAALGEDKWRLGLRLARSLRDRMAPGGLLLCRQGKHYPGESLPRWALDLIWRKDGKRLWRDTDATPEITAELVGQFAERLAAELGLSHAMMEAFDDPWHFIQQEARLPVDVDPLEADLSDGEERRRLARLLDRGLGEVAGYVIPTNRIEGQWRGATWTLRRDRLYLLPGDAPVGLRLPLNSVAAGWLPPPPATPVEITGDPRMDDEPAAEPLPTGTGDTLSQPLKTAICIEASDDCVQVFLPPLMAEDDFESLVGAIDSVSSELEVPIRLAGYAPPKGDALRRFAVTPDPGVLEVNIPPTSSTAEYSALIDTVFASALESGLHAEKYLMDGRQHGSGGGNHITMGGPSLLESPFIQRPDLLASLITFVQHHPSLSYLFTGLFVGPTSQAPRVDEARLDSLYELDLALERAHEADGEVEPWLSDLLFRNLLVDLTGNTHRSEICIDKLCDPSTPHGRQGLAELRAFEMPPHPRLAVAQVALVRALMAGFARTPYRAPLIRFGQSLHDRYLLPYFLWQDFRSVLAWLEDAGVGLPEGAYRPFLEFRCPKVGQVVHDGIQLTLRNALEPWNVLGEESGPAGTSRFVDSSMERVEVHVTGLEPGRHGIVCNGLTLPLHPGRNAGELVAGIRFRAWAPPRSLQAHLGIHHPLRFDVVDLPARRSLGAAAYHVWHPEGRAFDAEPLTRFEAAARRAQRFTDVGPLPWPVEPTRVAPHPDTPLTLDLRRFPIDRPMPEPEAE